MEQVANNLAKWWYGWMWGSRRGEEKWWRRRRRKGRSLRGGSLQVSSRIVLEKLINDISNSDVIMRWWTLENNNYNNYFFRPVNRLRGVSALNNCIRILVKSSFVSLITIYFRNRRKIERRRNFVKLYLLFNVIKFQDEQKLTLFIRQWFKSKNRYPVSLSAPIVTESLKVYTHKKYLQDIY